MFQYGLASYMMMEVALDYKSCRALNKEENTWLFDICKFFIQNKITKAEGRKLHLHLVGKVLVIHVLYDLYLDMFLLK